jgi:hypothetical protein
VISRPRVVFFGTIEIREHAGRYAVTEEEGNLKFECQSFEIL